MGLIRNWVLVFLGNFLGSLLYAGLYWIAATEVGHDGGGAVADQLRALAIHKTTAYESLGMAGLLTVFVRAILCNWMVSLASVMGLASSSTVGKILGCWLPIFIFFSQGFEHSVVNMFVIPIGIMLGAHISFYDWWVWNEIPVTIGNAVGALVFTGGALYFTYRRTDATVRTIGRQAVQDKRTEKVRGNVVLQRSGPLVCKWLWVSQGRVVFGRSRMARSQCGQAISRQSGLSSLNNLDLPITTSAACPGTEVEPSQDLQLHFATAVIWAANGTQQTRALVRRDLRGLDSGLRHRLGHALTACAELSRHFRKNAKAFFSIRYEPRRSNGG
jgi:Formate/nitrite transporter